LIIYQPPKGYCYNSDTIFLYHFLRSLPVKGEVLDVGTGSGILALLIARDFPNARVSAIEVQERFVQYARINAQANKKDITIYFGDFLHMVFGKKFDFLVSNPPFYHKNVLRSQDKMVDRARYSGFLPLDEFFKKAGSILTPRGMLVFCYDAKQIMDIITKLEHNKFNIERMKFVHPNAQKAATLVLIAARKSSKALCRIDPPLIVFENGRYREETNEIFKEVGVHSIKCPI